jgi:hypothetical protein
MLVLWQQLKHVTRGYVIEAKVDYFKTVVQRQ